MMTAAAPLRTDWLYHSYKNSCWRTTVCNCMYLSLFLSVSLAILQQLLTTQITLPPLLQYLLFLYFFLLITTVAERAPAQMFEWLLCGCFWTVFSWVMSGIIAFCPVYCKYLCNYCVSPQPYLCLEMKAACIKSGFYYIFPIKREN